MLFAIRHTTHYDYYEAAGHTVARLCLSPPSGPCQLVDRWSIKAPGALFARVDGWGNLCHSYSVIGGSVTSQIVAQGVVQTLGIADWCEDAAAPHPLLFLRTGPLTEPHARMQALGALCVSPQVRGDVLVAALLGLAFEVQSKVSYQKNRTAVDTVALEAFDWGAGVCQDQAHVMLTICRSLGLPARYVSGYFWAENEPDLASHAWVDVCVDVASRRWVSIDVTHACLMDTRHVRIATGIDYTSCTPVRGVRQGGSGEDMRVEVNIRPLKTALS